MARFQQEQARWWSYQRQHLGQTAKTLEQAVRDVIGVYSAHPSGPLSLHARVNSFSKEHFDALDIKRHVLRIPAMRFSIHIVPREMAYLILAATRTTLPEYRYVLLHDLLTEDDYLRLKSMILKVADHPMSVGDVRKMLGEEVIPLSDILKTMCREGVLLRVAPKSLRSNALQYVATTAWLGGEFPSVEGNQALRWLAHEYVRAFGPVRPVDFVWWTGVPAKRAMAALATLDTVDIGDGYLLLAEDEKAFQVVLPPPRGTVDVLPKWDCYTMGYAPDGRTRFASSDVQNHIYDSVGNAVGAILVEGMAVGTWDVHVTGSHMTAQVQHFERLPSYLQETLKERLQDIAHMFGVSLVSVH